MGILKQMRIYVELGAIIFLSIFVALFLHSCSKSYGAQTNTFSADTVAGSHVVDTIQNYSVVDMRLVRMDGSSIEFKERPIPVNVKVELIFSRALNSTEKSEFQEQFALFDNEKNSVRGSIEWANENMQMFFSPAVALNFGTTYTVSNIKQIGVETSFKTMVCGDIDGDGIADFLVGAPGALDEKGKVYVMNGSVPGGKLIAEITGENDNERMGSWVAPAGDVNDDGYEDFVVTVGNVGARQNNVLIVNGKSVKQGPLEFLSAAGRSLSTGPSTAVAGNLDGDGNALIIIGDSSFDSSRGKIFIRGRLGEMNKLSSEMTGQSAGDNYGAFVASAGDVNGDEITDFIVGSYGSLAMTGAAYIYSGADLSGRPLAMRIGNAAGDRFGMAVAGVGDINGDGRDDVIVGAPMALSDQGSVHIYSGADIGGKEIIKKSGEKAGDAFGSSVAGAGDTNGDGKIEVIIGAPHFSDVDANIGRVYIYNDTDHMKNPLTVLTGKFSGEMFGSSVAGACPML